jgi:hypothetical protein
MVVLYQGWLYARDPKGDLTLTGDTVAWPWPTSADFYAAIQYIREAH